LADTEEAAFLLDLWSRVDKYPLEYLIESMAPTVKENIGGFGPDQFCFYIETISGYAGKNDES
jgi:hypothetical protein